MCLEPFNKAQQFAATVAFDVYPAQASETRRRIMAELAESRELVGGHHLDFPGIGYVAEDADGVRFYPASAFQSK